MSLWIEQSGQGPDLVMLHGWGMSSEIWQPLREWLEPHFRLTLIDLPGLGRSSALPACDADTLAEHLLEQAPQRAIWLGWSLGGTIATVAARRAPSRVSALVTVASNPCFVVRDDWPCAMERQTFDAFVAGVQAQPEKTLQRFAALQVQGSVQARQELKRVRTLIAGSDVREQALLQTLALLQEDHRAQLSALSQPCLHLLGQEDALVPVSLADGLARLQPTASIQTLEGASHLPFLTDPQWFVHALRTFVADREVLWV